MMYVHVIPDECATWRVYDAGAREPVSEPTSTKAELAVVCAMSDSAVSPREATARSAGIEREPLTDARRARGGPWSTAVVSEARR
jgi:hypothetical protein